MRQDRHFADIGITRQRLQHRLERVTRITRAFVVVSVGEQLAARGPGKQHGDDVRGRVVRDLRKAIDGFLEARVEAMHENENLALGRFQDAPVEFGDGRLLGENARLDRRKFAARIGRRALRPLHLADLAVCVRRKGDDNVGEGDAPAALA